MAFSNPQDSITLPADATTGARIVLDGTTNKITVYDANDNAVIVIDASTVPGPSITIGDDASGIDAVIRLLSSFGSALMQFETNGPTVALAGSLQALEATVGAGIPPNQLQLSLLGPSDDGGLVPEFRLTKVVGGNRIGTLDVERFDIDATATNLVNGGLTSAGNVDVSGSVNATQSATTNAVTAKRTGDTTPRVMFRSDGAVIWGDGAGSADARIFRSGIAELTSHQIKAILAGNVAETWHGLAYQNGWTDGSNVAGKYRKVPSPGNSIQLVGELIPGTKADGTVIANLPSGYRPASVTSFPIAANPVPAGTTTPLLQVLANGDIQCFGLVVATTRVYFSVVIPLDA